MLIIKRLSHAGVLFAVLLAMLVMPQTSLNGQETEMTVEQSYLQESVEMVIIREQSRSNSRDNKLVALDYIGSAINRGSTSAELQATLDYLSLEGILNKTTENGRVVNNFPDVRRQAAIYLGQLGTPEAKTSLIKMLNADYETMVISEAIRALGIIGTNENNESSTIIAWTFNRFNTLSPDNFLAITTLDALERLAIANKGLTDPLAFETMMRISENYIYITPVRNRARELMDNLLKGNYNQ